MLLLHLHYDIVVSICVVSHPLPPDTLPHLQRGVVQSDSLRDKGVLKSVCPAIGKEQFENG